MKLSPAIFALIMALLAMVVVANEEAVAPEQKEETTNEEQDDRKLDHMIPGGYSPPDRGYGYGYVVVEKPWYKKIFSKDS